MKQRIAERNTDSHSSNVASKTMCSGSAAVVTGPFRKRILTIDNYDSFTWNLVQYLSELGAEVRVERNDAIELADIEALQPAGLVFSPGPCTPSEAGITLATIRRFAGEIPMLGVCLGHQAIGAAFGGEIIRAARVMHGKTSAIRHYGTGVFRGLQNPLTAIRYHSLVVSREGLPDCLEITAEADDGEIMGVRHRAFDIEGVQFHPESFLSEHGYLLLRNFLQPAQAVTVTGT